MEKVKELCRIIEENPELKVEFLVDSETICEEFKWTQQKIISVEIEDVWFEDGDLYYGEEMNPEEREVERVILVKLSA
jgi:hypothetical protein